MVYTFILIISEIFVAYVFLYFKTNLWYLTTMLIRYYPAEEEEDNNA